MKITRKPHLVLIATTLFCGHIHAQSAYELQFRDIPGGTFTIGEPEDRYEGPPGSYDAQQFTVTLSAFQISETEVTNQQYVDFLNAAISDGLIEVAVETQVQQDIGFTLVYGTDEASEQYRGQAILNLSGTRVMKDHDNDDNDNDSFTGVIEPENPLNISYIGYDDSLPDGEKFYVKDPQNAEHFDWQELTNYYNYTDVTRQLDQSVQLNDYDEWPELEDYPNNLPTLDDIKNYPATFIRWHGAKAFALYYDYELPSEAQWEYVSKAVSDYVYATADGGVAGDGTSAIWNHLEDNPSKGHVLDVKSNSPNPFGLYNLAGNVWEWVEDWYDADFYSESTDPVNTTESDKKVRRGGAWNYHLSTLKSAARAEDEQFKGNDHFGFRVAKPGASSDNGGDEETAVAFDYDGDRIADIIVRRPSTFFQYGVNSQDDSVLRAQFGKDAGDIPVSGDFDGDGIADIAVRRPGTFYWYIQNSSGVDPLTQFSDGITRVQFGKYADDIPVPADYDGDGKTDIAVRRPSSQTWYILNSSGSDLISGFDDGITRQVFGRDEADIPVPADYDGDGKADLAVRRASNQYWYVLNSAGEDLISGFDDGITRMQFGKQEEDIPVPADYDGDGKVDLAVRRASNQYWFILNSSGTDPLTGNSDAITRHQFGKNAADIPVVADYDGDGKADLAVRRASNYTWYILNSSGDNTNSELEDGIQRRILGEDELDIPHAAPVLTRMAMLQNVDD